MAKNLRKQLDDRRTQKKSARYDRNAVAFIAVQNDIRDALDAGYAIKSVWEILQESKRIDFGYETFRRYVIRFIRNTPVQATSQPKIPAPQPTRHAGTPAPVTPAPAKKPKLPGPPGFNFNPAPNNEELF